MMSATSLYAFLVYTNQAQNLLMLISGDLQAMVILFYEKVNYCCIRPLMRIVWTKPRGKNESKVLGNGRDDRVGYGGVHYHQNH